MPSRFNQPLKLLTLLWLSAVLLAPSLAESAYYSPHPIAQNRILDPIPEATKPCTEDEATWWQSLREAGRKVVSARIQYDQLESRLLAGYRVGEIISNEELASLNKRRQEEQGKLNADIESSTARYLDLLREGKDKSFRVPLADQRPQMLYRERPRYSEEARENKINGTIILRVRADADGTVGDVRVTRGLGYGLDDNTIDLMRRTVWLPAVMDGVFVQFWQMVELDYHLK